LPKVRCSRLVAKYCVDSEKDIMTRQRNLCWFSCGAPSAVAAKLALQELPNVEVLYCDTFAYEHPDNRRFFDDVQKWLDHEIKILSSTDYTDIFDVFHKTKFLVSPQGARCTVELKKKVRFAYQQADDIHLLGYTSEENHRVIRFNKANPELFTDPILVRYNITKRECQMMIKDAGIELPMMYRLGYKNNNCIGCVKGGMGYWNKIRDDFPESFDRMALTERELGISVLRKNGQSLFLDELPRGVGHYPSEPDISCGVQCVLFRDTELPILA